MNHFTQQDWEARYGRKNNHGQPQIGLHVDIELGEVHNFPIEEIPGYQVGSLQQPHPQPHMTSTDCPCLPLIQYIEREYGTQIVATRHSFELRGLERQGADR